MEIHPIDIAIHIINIAVLFFLLRLILWKPVNKFLASRAQRVQSDLECAEKTRLDAEALKQEYADDLSDIEARGREIIRDSNTKASEEAEDILSEAHEKANEMIVEARKRIAEEKERAVESARREVAHLATDMASRILKREVLPEDNKSVVEDFFSETR